MMLANPLEILGNEEGWVRGVRCIRMELGEPDESGRRSPKAVPGSEFEIPCDTVIMSLGTSPNPLIASTTEGLQTTRWGGLIANDEGATTREGVFAGGDAVTGAATVILAMGAGRKRPRLSTPISRAREPNEIPVSCPVGRGRIGKGYDTKAEKGRIEILPFSAFMSVAAAGRFSLRIAAGNVFSVSGATRSFAGACHIVYSVCSMSDWAFSPYRRRRHCLPVRPCAVFAEGG